MIKINFDVQRFTQYGTSGDDTITSNSSNNYVYAYAGNDFIRSSYSDYAYLDGGAGNDRISVQSNSGWGWNTTIRGGTGDDTIYGNSLTSGSSYGDVYVYSQGDGNDLIYGYTSYDTVSITGSSYYTRSTVGSSVVISMVSGGAMTLSGASGNTINIVGGTPTVIGGRYINITSDSSSYSSTDYNDTIYADDGDYVTVYAGAGNDTVSGYYYSSKIFGGAGADYFSIRGSYYSDTVDGGDGNDTIYAYYSASVNGGAGDDRITLNGYSGYIGTVRGGTGNDTIYGNTSYNHLYQYYYGDGSDIIYNVGNYDTISIGGASNLSTVASGSNVIVSVPGSGNITLVGASGKSFQIYPTVGPKNIDNYVSNTVLSGTTYSDSITNHADRVTIYGGDGNDTLAGSRYGYVSGGSGNDYIYYYGNGDGSYGTVNGGTGNDTIYSWGYTSRPLLYQYYVGDGYDYIGGYGSSDTISIGGGTYSTMTTGSNIVVSVYSGTSSVASGAMTLSSASDKTLNIIGTIRGGGRYISITSDYSSYSGTDYNDTIYADDGDYVTVYAGAGNDTVSGYYYSSKIFGGAGADYFSIRGSYYSDTVDGGDGNDTIYAYYSASVNGGAGDDRITLNGYSGYIGTVRGGTGNDTIYGNTSYNHLYQYYYGDGSDIIYNVGNYDTISIGGASSWSSVTSGSNVIVSVPGSGNITLVGASGKSFKVYPVETGVTISNSTSNTVINATAYNDSVFNTGSNVTVNFGDGNDSISNRGSNVSINGGAGNDAIDLDPYYFGTQRNVTLTGGAGNDTFIVDPYNSNTISAVITDFTSNDVFVYDSDFDSPGSKKLTYSISGGNMIIQNNQSSNGSYISPTFVVTLQGVSSLEQIASARYQRVTYWNPGTVYENTTFGNLFSSGVITNTVSSATVNGTSGNDTMSNTGATVTVYAGAGADTVYNSGRYSKIDAGAGNDSIYEYFDDYSTVDGGDGADTIVNYGGAYSSINGGAGGDLISVKSVSGYIYKHTIRGGTGNDTIYSNSLASVSSGGSVYQYIYGDGNDTIYGVTSYDTISIVGGSYTRSTVGSNVILNMSDGGSIMLYGASGKSLQIYPTISTGVTLNNTSSYVTVNGSSSNDSIKNSGSRVTISTGDSADTISNTGVSLLAYAGAGNDSLYNTAADSATLSGGAGNDTLMNFWSNGGNYVSMSGGAGSDYIYDNYGYYVTLDGGDDDDTITVYRGAVNSINGGAGADRISLSTSYGVQTVRGGAGNDTIYGDTFNSYGVVYQYASGDGNDTIYNFHSNDTLSISGSYSTTKSGNDLIYYVGSGSVRLVNYTVPSVFTEGNDYYANSKSSTVLNALGGNDTIYNSATNVTIIGGAGDDSLYHYSTSYSSSYVTMNGGDGNDTIRGRMGDSSIFGGAGNDVIDLSLGDVDRATVNGGIGNDTIYSDNYDGRNTFQYASGDGADVIYYLKSADTLHVTSGSVSNTTVSGSDVILYVGSGSITLKNKKDSYFYLKTGSGSAVQTVISGGGRYISNSNSNTVITGTGYDDTVYNSGKYVTINVGAGNDSIYHYATSYSGSYVTVNAGDGNDTIRGRYGDSSIFGGAGNDVIDLSLGDVDRATVNGGTGNDLIYNDGYDGRNVFVYQTGDGNDTIYNFTDRDMLSISGSYSTTRSGNDLIYNVGSGSVILKNYAPTGVTISNSNSNTVIGGTADGDSIKNSGGNVTINAGDGNDTIWNYYSNGGGNYVAINAGAGNDTIYNDWGYYLTIDAGAGNDTITVYRGYADTINAGAGDDKISLGSSYGANTVRGGAGNDTIYGDTLNSYGVIYQYLSGDGNDVIYNFHSNDTLTGATFTSVTSGSNIILSMSGGGYVTLVGAASIPPVIFTEGADSYTNTRANTLLSALAGNDTVYNSASKVTINAGDGDDRISNTGVSLTAYGGAGNDSVYNSGDYSYIDLGDGADSLYVYDNDYVTVQAGAGADTITGSFYRSKIDGGAGADKISVTSGANAIDGGDGDDTISAYGGSISGGAGDDRITLNGNYSVRIVRGGTGNDIIYGAIGSSYGTRYEYAYGDGSDVIYNFSAYDTISIAGTSQYTTLTSGGNKIVSVIGSGAMTLNGASSTALNIIGGTYVPSGNEGVYITNSTSNRTLVGTAKNDTIENIYSGGGDIISIDAGAGNDTIYNNWGYYVTINAGAGDDTITSYRGSSNSIDGGTGADIISLGSSNGLTVVKGGAGNDTIHGDTAAQLFQYANGDGYDVINGYSANDSITITGGDWSKATVGNDVIISVTNTGSTVQTGAITLSGAKGKAINVYPTAPTPSPAPNPNPNVTQQQVIQKFMGVLDTVTSDGIGRLNQAVSVASGGYFNGINAAIDQMVSDCQNASSANDFLLNYCGINLNNSDTGAITGSDAGGSATKTATSIVPESGSVNNFGESSFTTKGLTVYLSNIEDHEYESRICIDSWNKMSCSSLKNDKQKYIWQAFRTWWASGALNLIEESYGSNYSFGANYSSTSSPPIARTLYFGFTNLPPKNGGITLAYTGGPCGSNSTDLVMAVNMVAYDDITIGDAEGYSSSWDNYLDRTLAHEMTHAIMKSTVNNFGNLPQFITEGMAELTHGIDDDRGDLIRYLAGSPYTLRNSLGMMAGTGNSYSYAGGYMFLRYLAKQSSDNSGTGSSLSGGGSMSAIIANSNNASGKNITAQRGVTVSGAVLTAGNTFDEDMIDLNGYSSAVTKVNATALTDGVMIIGNTKANSISAGKGNDTVSGNLGNDTITGGTGNDMLMGDAGNDKISGDAGNDTLMGGYGNDTLTGGAGSDVFVHVAGNDIITDYVAGQDKIQLVEGGITGASLSGSNVVLTTTDGTITVNNGKNKQLTVIDKDGNETTGIYPTVASAATSGGVSVKGAVLTASTVFSGDTIDLSEYDTTVTKVDASKLTQGVSILGNAKANSLKGGAGADTLYGGAGNDTLTGGNGADVFVYESGNDVITDYVAGADKIKLVGASLTSASISSSNVVLKTSAGNLTVKGGKGKQLTIIDADDKETTQTYPSYFTYDGGKTAMTLASGFTGTLKATDYESTVTKVDASAITKALTLNGNAQDNSIVGGTGNDKILGNAGNDTLYGGAGNDTLTGGAGSDTFVYASGTGKDVIADYAAGDTIKISSGSITATSYKSSDVVFTVGSGTLTVKNAKGKAITVTDAGGKTTTKTYTNGVTYGSNGLRGSNALWFTEDDTNFIGGGAKLDDITAENYSVTQIETQSNFENFAQNETLLAHTDK